MTIRVSIPRKFEELFTDFYPGIKIDIPDSRFSEKEVINQIESTVENMLAADPYRTSGRAVIKVQEGGSWATESFQLLIDFNELTGVLVFKRSNRGQSRMI